MLWTRLAVDPLTGGGMPARPVPVRYEVAHDERFRRRVARGTAIALPELGHAVHPEVTELEPDREYHYRFIAGGEESPTKSAGCCAASSAHRHAGTSSPSR